MSRALRRSVVQRRKYGSPQHQTAQAGMTRNTTGKLESHLFTNPKLRRSRLLVFASRPSTEKHSISRSLQFEPRTRMMFSRARRFSAGLLLMMRIAPRISPS